MTPLAELAAGPVLRNFALFVSMARWNRLVRRAICCEAVGSVTGRENRQLLIVFIVAFSKNLNLLIIERKWFPPKAVIYIFEKNCETIGQFFTCYCHVNKRNLRFQRPISK